MLSCNSELELEVLSIEAAERAYPLCKSILSPENFCPVSTLIHMLHSLHEVLHLQDGGNGSVESPLQSMSSGVFA